MVFLIGGVTVFDGIPVIGGIAVFAGGPGDGVIVDIDGGEDKCKGYDDNDYVYDII